MQRLFLKTSKEVNSLQQQSAITIPIGGRHANNNSNPYGNGSGYGNRKDPNQRFYLSSQKRRLDGLLEKLEQ